MKTLLPALLVLSTAMFAQRPGPRQDPTTTHVATMTTLLSLSSGQQSQATTIYSTAHTAQKALQTQMHTAETALRTAIKNNDVATIDTLTAQIGTLHAQSLSIESKAEASFYSTLSAEQKTKYDTLHMRGFGGPGGPGGGPRGDFRPMPPQ
jgi:Spy/CpxP family protein refolding chaperone